MRYVSGWIPYWANDAALDSFRANADLFSDVSPFWHSLTSDTSVIDQDSEADRARTIGAARAVGVPVIPAVTDGMGKGNLAAALADPARRSTVVQTLVALTTSRGYDGLDLDLEGFAFTDGRESWAATRPNWVAFVAELGSALRARGKQLFATIPPTYDSNRAPTSGYWVYDYAGIAPHVDKVRIMAYDYSVAAPGPIAPYDWVTSILNYAVTQIPRSKLVLGIPTYGRDWVTSVAGSCPAGTDLARRSLTASAAWRLASTKGVPVAWDAGARERTFDYTETASNESTSCTISRKVFFSDASAVADRAQLVDQYQIAGIVLWSLGGEDAAQWPALRKLAVLDPGWQQVPGAALDIAFAQISGGWEMFHIGLSGTIFRKKWQNGSTTGWTPIPGLQAKRIAVATSADGRVELFHIGMNDAVFHNWETTPGGEFSATDSLGGYAKEIAAARSGDQWEVYHVGGSGQIWRATQTARPWQALPGTWAASLAATTNSAGRVELFHIGGNGQTYHAWQNTPGGAFFGPVGINSWNPHGGNGTTIAAANGINGSYEVYTTAPDGSLNRLAPASIPYGWQRIAGTGTRIAATNSPDGRVEVLHMNSVGNMYQAWQKRPGAF